MATNGADTAALSGLAKDVFEQGVTELANNMFPLAKEFPTEQVDWKGGEGHVWAAHVSRNTSPFFAGEDSAYPVAGHQTHVKGRIDMRKMMARIRMTEEAMSDLVSSEASFRNGMTDEKTRLADDVAKKEEYALSNDGRGVLGVLNGTHNAVTTLTLKNPGNVPGANFGNRFFFTGQIVLAVNPATGLLRTTAVTITSTDSAGATCVCSPATGTDWADADYVVQVAATTSTDILDSSYEKAFWGLPALIDDNTNRDNYFGISRTQFGNLKSYVKASVGAFSLDTAQLTADVAYEKLGGEIDLLLMHQSVRREYIKLLQDDRRYAGADLKSPDGGTKAMKQGDLTLGEVPVKAIRTLGLGQVYFLDTKKSGFKRYVAEPGKFMDRDGSIWLREGTGASARHAYEATYFMRKQYFCKNPGYNARWDGVNATLVVVRDE